ncbi:NHL domain-containing protein [Parafrankia discariae]|uniref:NHL domain-containing protein n=1 Tax=Parafrankia discariae TaxID=365528 RepID=UPI000366C803|nr:protein kinase [Parafrankia discariae]
MSVIDRARVAAVLPGYVLGRELGAGAFGLVIAGRRLPPATGLGVDGAPAGGGATDVAVKILDLGLAGGPAADGSGGLSAATFVLGSDPASAAPPDRDQDARILTQLGHPHLCQMIDIVPVDGLRLLVSELLPGGTLVRQSLTPPAACAVVLAVADALMHAHAAGVLHRDVKPANILFTAAGRPALTDLGVVGLVDGTPLTAGRIVGTAQYLAPEQVTGGRLGPATDVYALAATLYELLAGTPLFGAGLTAPDLLRHHCEVVPAPPPGVPPPVAAVLARALAKAPGERHRTAGQFAMDLAAAARLGYGGDWLARADVPLAVSDGLREQGSGPHPALAPPGTAAPGTGHHTGAEDDPADRTTRLDPPLPPVTSLLLEPMPTGPPDAFPLAAPGGPAGGGAGPAGHMPGGTGATSATETGPAAGGPPARPGRDDPADPHGPGGPDGPEGPAGRRASRRRVWLVGAAVAAVLAVVAALVVPRVTDDGPAVPGAAAASPLSGPGPAASAQRPGPLPPPPRYPVVTVAGTGEAAFSGDGGPAGSAALNGPFGMVADWAGNIYVADFDNNRVRRITADGTITTVAGTGEAGFSGDGGPATRAQLRQPAAVALDAAGNILIADTFNQRIRRVDPAGIITTVAGKDDRGFGGDGVPATEATLWYPGGVVADPTGNIYIADSGNNRIRRVGTDGIIQTVAGGDGEGAFGDGGPAADALLAFPISVAMDRPGRLYIADSGNNRVRRIGLDGVIETVAGTGLPGYSGDGGPATRATLRSPRGVAVDARGTIFVTDRTNRRIRRVDPSGIITTVAGTAHPGRDESVDPDAMSPDGPVALDPTGDVFVADRRHNRVLHVTLTGPG